LHLELSVVYGAFLKQPLAFLFAMSVFFKHQVNQRTTELQARNKELEVQIEERQQAEHALCESEGRLQAILANTSAAHLYQRLRRTFSAAEPSV
jgi:phosphoglycerate-specific signal transduction histidine kinase